MIVDTPAAMGPRIAVAAAVLLSSYAIAMEMTVVSAAIPTVIENFGGLSDLSWIFSAYLIAQAITMPMFGRASDRLGRRECYAFAATLFFFASFACGLAWDILSLVLFRILQGIGGAGLTTVGMAALNDVIPHVSRGKYQALSSAVWGIAAISGPIVGAMIMALLDWRYIFWLNLPVVVASAALLCAFYPGRLSANSGAGTGELATAPSLCLCVALLALMVALTYGHSLTALQLALCVAVGGSATAVLVRSQHRSTDPLVPRALLRARNVKLAVTSAFLCGAITMGMTVYVPSFTALILQADYLTISSSVATMTLTWTFSGMGVGLLMKIGQQRRLAKVGAWVVLSGALGLCQVAHVAEHSWSVLAMSGVLGIGLGACSVVFSVTLQSTVDNTMRGSVTSLFYLSRMLGQAIGVALCGGVLAGSDLAASQLMQPSQHPAAPVEATRAVAYSLQTADLIRGRFVMVFALLAALALAHLLYVLHASKSNAGPGASSPRRRQKLRRARTPF